MINKWNQCRVEGAFKNTKSPIGDNNGISSYSYSSGIGRTFNSLRAQKPPPVDNAITGLCSHKNKSTKPTNQPASQSISQSFSFRTRDARPNNTCFRLKPFCISSQLKIGWGGGKSQKFYWEVLTFQRNL